MHVMNNAFRFIPTHIPSDLNQVKAVRVCPLMPHCPSESHIVQAESSIWVTSSGQFHLLHLYLWPTIGWSSTVYTMSFISNQGSSSSPTILLQPVQPVLSSCFEITTASVCHILSALSSRVSYCGKSGIIIVSPSQKIKLHKDDPTITFFTQLSSTTMSHQLTDNSGLIRVTKSFLHIISQAVWTNHATPITLTMPSKTGWCRSRWCNWCSCGRQNWQ